MRRAHVIQYFCKNKLHYTYQPFQSLPNQFPQINLHNPEELTNIQRRNNQIIISGIEEFQREIKQESDLKMLIESGFPSQEYQDLEGIKYFYQAFDEINSMA